MKDEPTILNVPSVEPEVNQAFLFNGRMVRLGKVPAKFLHCLMQEPGCVYSRVTIADYIWGEQSLNKSTSALDNILTGIRQRMPGAVLTSHGYGWYIPPLRPGEKVR